MNEESGVLAAENRSSLAAGIATRVGTIAVFIAVQAVILLVG